MSRNADWRDFGHAWTTATPSSRRASRFCSDHPCRDVGDPAIFSKLSEIAPVVAVRGNVDRGGWAKTLPLTNLLEVEGITIYILHNLEDLDLKPEAARFAAVIYGHSHIPKHEVKNGVLYFNPGSAGPKRFRLPVTLGKLIITDGQIEGQIVQLVP